MKSIVISLVLCAGGVFSASLFTPCRIDDSKCLTMSFQGALPKILSGIPELDVESSDPLYADVIESNQTALNINYSKITVKGYKNSEIRDVKFNPQNGTLNYDLIVTVDISGDYKIKGRLLVLQVEGDGKIHIDAKRVLLRIEADTKESVGSDGKKRLGFKNFTLKAVEVLGKCVFSFTNLFNGNQKLADGVIKYANENDKDVTREVAPAFFDANLKKMFKNVNKYLKAVPIDEIFILQ